ncbi:MAG: glycoside hydrolase family 2 protein [Oscillospiraceae bacterium]|nr:glycoside hydrolase family 2 protein [Oscillospiraceae bacterium]
MISLCNNWEFTETWSDAFAMGEGSGETVRLPHTVRQLPLHYADHESYQMVCGYRRTLTVTEEMLGKRLFLQFDGAAHIATVYVNGEMLATHRCGYTAFRVEITGAVRLGENRIAVKLDTTENESVPPFGFVIDYLTYGGLYREVWLDVREKAFLSDLYITTPTTESVRLEITAENAENCRYLVEILTEEGEILLKKMTVDKVSVLEVPGARVWSCEDPYRHSCRVSLMKNDAVLDVQEVKFGFRTAQFRENGFFLNGKQVFLRGLNRHQCWPYMGYGAPESLQREDARILKEELGCVIVRTSHYPQSQHFIDECDRLGLLVFTEIPGWQHIGEAACWQDQCVENTREMVLQYRNHPSIILWGVRINESQDCDELYRRTNEVARELDGSRPTTGVRFHEQSSLLEDVYGYNDFSHTGSNGGVKPKRAVTPDVKKPLLITEHNGHMFPTKSFDPWLKRQEHALRHARVQNDAASDGEHIGCIGWCMFDYATHKDFGSGDRICYHGVLDAFRNPKTAAAVYASQQEKIPVLEVASSMDIGDYAAGNIGAVSVFSNADEVRLYKNDLFVSTLSKGDFGALKHPPLVLDDGIGDLLETQEGFPKPKAELLKKALLSAAKYGLAGMHKADLLRMGYAMVRYKMSYKEGVALYGKYVGNWGGAATVWRFDAIKDGEVVKSVTCSPNTALHLEATPSSRVLREGASYDMAAVRIRILDGNGNTAPYAQLPVRLTLEGPAQLVGPDAVTAEGGMCGTYIRTTGESGTAKLTVSAHGLKPVTVEFTVR